MKISKITIVIMKMRLIFRGSHGQRSRLVQAPLSSTNIPGLEKLRKTNNGAYRLFSPNWQNLYPGSEDSIQMQSTSQDSPSVMQQESGNPIVVTEAPGGTSIETTGNTLQSTREDSSRISREDPPKSPTPKKRSHTMSQQSSDGDGTIRDVQNQLVIYDPEYANRTQGAIPVPIHNDNDTSPFQNSPGHVILVVGDLTSFSVQCIDLFKWRLVPNKDRYDEIHEHSTMESPFTCRVAQEWRPDITCDDPEDISKDGSNVWAIDKHNIARPPPGWKRELRIRAAGGDKICRCSQHGSTSIHIVPRFKENASYSIGKRTLLRKGQLHPLILQI